MWFSYAEAHGDHSSEFTFTSLFPRPLRPFVGCFAEIVYSCSVAVAPGFAKLREADGSLGTTIMYDPAKASGATGSAGGELPLAEVPAAGPARAEYNARRAKALQLLDENISSLLGGGKSGTPKKTDEHNLENDEDL